MKSNKPLILRAILTIPIVGAMAFGGVSAYAAMSSNARITEVQSNPVRASEAADMLLANTSIEHPGEWIAVATALSSESPENDARSIELLERALSGAPNDASAWALLSFLHARHSGAFTARAESALRESNVRCPLCNKALLQWRLTFTLQHWDQVPEDIRMSAFEGADFLRWWYSDHDYLRQVGDSAKARGIPFNEYRRKVDTKVRPNEIPQAN